MAKNKIFQLRKAANLTQRELAAKAGTSQQQIQRIEAGVISVRLDLATRIAGALGAALSEVFPSLAKSKKARRRIVQQHEDPEIEIEHDPSIWTAKFFMFDGRKFVFEISSFDKDRIESIVGGSQKTFLVFNSRDRCVAVNRTKIAACQLLFDPAYQRVTQGDESDFELILHRIFAHEPLAFGLEPDTKTPLDDAKGLESQLQLLFLRLEGISDTSGEDEVIWFDDVDGERVYIRTGELLAIDVPLECCEPELWKKTMEGFEEELANKTTSPGQEP